MASDSWKAGLSIEVFLAWLFENESEYFRDSGATGLTYRGATWLFQAVRGEGYPVQFTDHIRYRAYIATLPSGIGSNIEDF